MKEQILKIAKDLEQGTITDNEARTLLLGLLGVSNLSTAFEEWQAKYPLVNLETAEWQLTRFLSSL